MEKKVNGNTEGLKKSMLDMLLSIYDDYDDSGCYCTQDTLDKICAVSFHTKREIAVYIDKRDRVILVAVGDSELVRTDYEPVKGMRLIHTHPSGTANLSSVDVETLKNSSLSAMSAVSMKEDGKMHMMYCACLDENNQPLIFGPYKKISQTLSFMSVLKETYHVKNDEIKITEHKSERIIAVGLNSSYSASLMEELESLISAAGGICVASIVQNKEEPDPAYYIGKGKITELLHACSQFQADAVVFDDELTYSQQSNIEAELNVKVLDRTSVILDIFAKRAFTNEGKLQVELAMLGYLYPRLTGKGQMLSRLGGGIGTRGPGESKLETDRRHIRRRMTYLKDQLDKVDKRRSLLRDNKSRKNYFTFAIAGYTNAGKSTLLNTLTKSSVMAEDMLFATLDPSARSMKLKSNNNAMLIDTVGFISKLPVKLVEAFKSTLDEIRYADCILHVIDGSSKNANMQMNEVYSILKSIGAGHVPVIEVVNKTDLVKEPFLNATSYPRTYISCVTGEGMESLLDLMDDASKNKNVCMKLKVDYSNGKLLAFIHSNAKILAKTDTDDGIELDIEIPAELVSKLDI
ncbi:MAG TPA: GTPase HflX [Clostridia bacterium]|nr:GTPase HflX [Clostridia bacterium]MDD4502423.1 GTPase HflX [Clostridia bacterium]HPB16175.1 GTPase HflX [Clostridia bacterium]HQM95952.1 GTPase HflX [Clostridia bacterium]HQO69122.1 GTPase HflX [Clostridia bacterium]